MFSFFFWVLAIWFVVNFIGMWFQLKSHTLQMTFAWINIVVFIIGLWVYFSAQRVADLSGWYVTLNYIAVILAIIQFYFGYRNRTKRS